MENLTEDMRCPKERVFFNNSVYMLVASLMISAWGHFLVQDISDWICIRHRFTDVCILIFWLILSHPEYKNKIKLSQCVAEPTCFSRIVFEQSCIIFLVSVGPTFCQAGPSRASLTVRCKWVKWNGSGLLWTSKLQQIKDNHSNDTKIFLSLFFPPLWFLCSHSSVAVVWFQKIVQKLP